MSTARDYKIIYRMEVFPLCFEVKLDILDIEDALLWRRFFVKAENSK